MASLEILAGSAVAADRAARCFSIFSKRINTHSGAPAILHGSRSASQADPLRTILVMLALPDGGVLFQLLDGVAARREGVGAVGRGRGDDHRHGAGVEAADAVVDGEPRSG